MQETWVGSLGQKDPPEKGMALQYSCLENPIDRETWGYTPQGHKESDRTEHIDT